MTISKMSTYINIGVYINKENNPHTAELISFSKNCTTGEYLIDGLEYTNEKHILTEGMLDSIIDDIRAEVNKDEARLSLLRSRVYSIKPSGSDPIDEYLEFKDYVEEKKTALTEISMLYRMLSEKQYEKSIVDYYYWIG